MAHKLQFLLSFLHKLQTNRRREASEMELVGVSSEVVVDNTKPVTAIPIKSPRGEPV